MRKKILFLLMAVFLLVNCQTASASTESELTGGRYYTLYNENKQIIDQTGLQVQQGDIYIDADNSRYEVTRVQGTSAYCVYQGKEKMPELVYNSKSHAYVFNTEMTAAASGKKPTVAVYHTHSDESYTPSDGRDSLNGRGGIYDVGEAFAKELEKIGFNVEYSKANHNPHDNSAYNRSRRTAAQLLKEQPLAIFDVHRDAAPAQRYATNVQGKEVTRVKLVVGRGNPAEKTNLDFAKRLKTAVDKKAPGLSAGIFIGKGDFNQDLSPRAMLVEVGSQNNKKSDAERGIQTFAQSIPTVLGVNPAKSTSDTPLSKPLQQGNQNSYWMTLLIIVVVVGAAIAGFILLNRGSRQRQ